MTIAKLWQEYKLSCYPDGCSLVQENETKQAFFSGCLTMFHVMSKISDQENEDRSVEELESVRQEVLNYLQQRRVNLRSRN